MFTNVMDILSTGMIPMVVLIFIGYGLYKKVDIYSCFINGAADGFNTVVRIVPYLVAIFVAIGVFRASGALDILQSLVGPAFDRFGLTADMIPHIMIRSLSGGGSTGIMAELVNNYGPDSFIGRVASVFQGGTSTTMYIITVYLGAVGIKKFRHTVAAGLITDAASFIFAVLIVSLVF